MFIGWSYLPELGVIEVDPLPEGAVVGEGGVVSAVVGHHARQLVLIGRRLGAGQLVEHLGGGARRSVEPEGIPSC